MEKYKNLMETLVEQKLSSMVGSLDCCKCEMCRNDIVAYALNQLPPKYIVTRQGELFSELSVLGAQYQADIVSVILHSVEAVKQKPRHPLE